MEACFLHDLQSPVSQLSSHFRVHHLGAAAPNTAASCGQAPSLGLPPSPDFMIHQTLQPPGRVRCKGPRDKALFLIKRSPIRKSEMSGFPMLRPSYVGGPAVLLQDGVPWPGSLTATHLPCHLFPPPLTPFCYGSRQRTLQRSCCLEHGARKRRNGGQ